MQECGEIAGFITIEDIGRGYPREAESGRGNRGYY